MKTKKTPGRAARRMKPAKGSATKKVRLNERAILKSINDEYWQIDITISNEDRVQLAGLIIRPNPPPPPIRPEDIVPWIRRSLGP